MVLFSEIIMNVSKFKFKLLNKQLESFSVYAYTLHERLNIRLVSCRFGKIIIHLATMILYANLFLFFLR